MAGDLLPAESPQQRDEQLTATGFLALTSKPRAQNNPDFRMDVVADQIEVATSGLMALTVDCARCHDHKFDPIPTAEYYSLAGVFASSETLYGSGGNGNGRFDGKLHELSGGDPKAAAAREEHLQAVADAEKQQKRLLNEARALLGDDAKLLKKIKANAKRALEIPLPKKASQELKQQVAKINADLKKLDAELKRLEKSAPGSAASAMGIAEGARPADIQICVRGESTVLGETVPRGFVTVAGGDLAPEIPGDASGRLQLAQWITSADNPLTARVMVNRVWLHLFGRALVPSVDNFGKLGELPSHPELLDYLAVQFMQEGWSVKQLIRSLVLSRTYGLSSAHHAANYEADPDNVYLWRHNARRLDAEAIRDSLLAVSGQLDLARPQASSAPTTGKNNRIVPSNRPSGAEPYRSVYLPIYRNALPEALELFDFADPSLVIGQRDVTTVPAQNLYLMNSPFVVSQAKQLAQRLQDSAGSNAERIALAYQITLAREPASEELDRAAAFIEHAVASYGESQKKDAGQTGRAWQAFCQALLSSAEFRYVE